MPTPEATTTTKNTKEYERLIKDISNVCGALVMYPVGHPIIEKQLNNLYQEITAIFKTSPIIAIHRGEGTVIINNAEFLANNSALEKITKHFNNFKITDLEISSGLILEELKNFLEIFAHSEESSKIYSDLNEACLKNQIENIKSLQAAYIRVPKNVKDKLGGKTVGELKISQEEMDRLVGYLKGEVELKQPSETKIYQKIFKNPTLLSGLVEKIIIESEKESPEKKKKMIIVVLNQIGNYLTKQSTNASQQRESLKTISNLAKALDNSAPLVALSGNDSSLKNEINQTVEKIKSLVKNQALLAEYSNYQKKLDSIREKIQKISPQLIENLNGLKIGTETKSTDLKKLLEEIKNILERLYQTKTIDEENLKKIKNLLTDLKNYI